MKKNILIILVIVCGMFLTDNVQAQREIQFSYDASGNMTSRVIDMSESVLESIAQSSDPVNINQNSDINSADTTEQSDNEESYFDQLGTTEIRIYPNPTTGKLVIDLPSYQSSSTDRIDIVDMQGVLRQRISPLEVSNTIYINDYPPATYIMLIHIGGKTTQWKIIKQ